MPSSKAISAPAGFVPQEAVSFAHTDGTAIAVSAAAPLPVTRAAALPATPTPLVGTTSASGTVGPIAPQLGRDLRLVLSDTWSGSAQVLTSTDGGTTRLPLTAAGLAWGTFTGNCNETIDSPSDSAAQYYL